MLPTRPTLFIYLLMIVLLASPSHAILVDVGGTYNVSGVNFPTNFGPEAVTLDLAAKPINGGQLTLQETIYPDGTDAEWLEFAFSTPNGGPLAGNFNALWRYDIAQIPTLGPTNANGVAFWWTVNGVAVDPIFNFGGLTVIPNPIDPNLGPAYGGIFNPVPIFDLFTFVNPYSFVNSGGINPNLANDFHAAIRLVAVPEPSLLWIAICVLLPPLRFGTGCRRRAYSP